MNDRETKQKEEVEFFEADIKNVSEQLPNHKMKEFTFTGLERQLLAEQQTIAALAGQTQDKVINEVCLKRLGVTPSPDIYVRYAIGLGRFVVFMPKSPKKEKGIKEVPLS